MVGIQVKTETLTIKLTEEQTRAVKELAGVVGQEPETFIQTLLFAGWEEYNKRPVMAKMYLRKFWKGVKK